MPVAVSMTEDVTRKDLKTCAGAWVDLRPMTYGQVVQRRALSKLSILSQKGSGKSFQGEMAMASKEITQFEFSHCIVDHNLEDLDGRKLNLNTAADFDRLSPKVGQEIESLISEMNNFDEDAEGD